VKSIALSGGPSGISLKNWMRPTSLRVAKSLTIQVTNGLITIAARDGDGNSIACLVRHEDPLMIAEVWRTYHQSPARGVEDLYLDLARDIDCRSADWTTLRPSISRGVLDGVEKAIKRSPKNITPPSSLVRLTLRDFEWRDG